MRSGSCWKMVGDDVFSMRVSRPFIYYPMKPCEALRSPVKSKESLPIAAPRSLRPFFAEHHEWLDATLCSLLYIQCNSICAHFDILQVVPARSKS
jgi:hypothetical protein